ncbi:MAG: hypothetical protein HC894_21315, partial [Microcoleus sp. SM1_3_4]|nr:hypothetical protein [Microcoleus sp. SM1_3_4]
VGQANVYGSKRGNYRYPRHIPTLRPQGPTTYRGAKYSRDRDPQPDEAASVAENTCKREAAAVKSPKAEVAQVHRANICNILDRRKQVAAAKGDERLLRLLEKEWQQMAC